jgi:hypothetical protein
MQKDEEDAKKRQMTFASFTEWVRLRPKEAFVGYISAILVTIDLVGHWKRKGMFCMPCQCGNVVFGNSLLGECKSCSPSPSSTSASQGRTVCLKPNPQILASISDETAGFTKGHNLLVADSAWEKLLGRSPATFEQKLYKNGRGDVETERMLKHWEQRLQYLRLTFVVGWTGNWAGGRMVIVHVLS